MKISENTILYYSPKYESFSVSIGGRDKDGDKYVTYMPVLIPDKEKRKLLVKKLDAHDTTACKLNIKEGFLGCFKTKAGEVRTQAVIQDYEIEEFYKKK